MIAMDAHHKEILERISKTAAEACVKPLSDLSEHEKLCIALVAGCQTDPTFNGFKLKNPVGFSYVNGRITVFERI